jgi:hypothetical protein
VSDNEPLESGDSYLAGWYLAIWEFQIRLVVGILFLPAAILSKTVFSSFADAQHSVSSKPLVRCGCISNWWKAGRLVQLFTIQHRGRSPPKQHHISFFSHRCSLSRIAVFSKPIVVQKVIAPKPMIGWGRVNIHSKFVDVLYFFHIQLSVRYKVEQHQISIYRLLLSVKPKWCHYQILLFGSDVVGLNVATRYGASKCYAPTRNLITTIESLWWFIDGIMLPSMILNQIASLRISFSPTSEWVSSTLCDKTSSLGNIVGSLR